MMTRSAFDRLWRVSRVVLMAGGVLFVLLMMTRWGGTARPGPLFVLGVAALAGLLVGFGVAVWWLFFSPASGPMPGLMPAGNAVRAAAGAAAEARQVVAVLVVLSGLSFTAGAFWDEVWHRLYGAGPAINDFWWRPHLMMYGSMALMALFAVGGLFAVFRGKGGLRQRFRAEPVIGLLGLASAYLAFSGPSDEIWHKVYGLDITAWSLPHIMFGLGTTLVMLAATGLQLSLLPRAGWRGLGGLRLGEVLIVLMLTVATLFLMQVGVTEWEVFRPITGFGPERDAFVQAFWDRPEWLYPVVLVTIVCFVGNVAVHALRRAGMATVVVLSVLAFRAVMVGLFRLSESPIDMPFVSQVLIVAPAVALDLWYASRLRQAETNLTLAGGNLAAALAFCLVSLPLLPQFLHYPRVNADTLPEMVVVGIVMASWAGWLGARVGGGLGTLERRAEAGDVVGRRVVWIGAGGLAAIAAFAAFFILTATPPAA